MRRRRRGIRQPKRVAEILFLADAKWETVPPVQYRAGSIVVLRIDLAMRWVSRGVATMDKDAIAAARPAPIAVAPAATPPPAAPPGNPLDHDGDGRPGGSAAPAPSDDLKLLREQYRQAIGRPPFPGWSADLLREKIAAAKTAPSASDQSP